MTVWSVRGREELEGTEGATEIGVERETAVEWGRGEWFSVSGGERQGDLGQNRERDLLSGIL